MSNGMNSIGRGQPRFDAEAKVRGVERYAFDSHPADTLWAGAVRAGVPSGRIRGVDSSAAAALPGVIAVLTAKDVPGTNLQGIVHKDQPVLAGDRVRHCGDPVALVIATDRETLGRARSLVRADIEETPAVFDPEEALRPGAPAVHDQGNLLLSALIEKGDTTAAFKECNIILEQCFEVPFQDHAFIEGQCGTARLGEDGRITITVSTQAPFRDRFEISHALGIGIDRIHVIAPFLGGGFGGKDGATVQCLLALAALHAGGRPVSMRWDREEAFVAGYKRHGARMYYRLGASSRGKLAALECRLYYNTGAYAHLGGEVMELGMEHAGGPYAIPHTRIEGWCVYTNNPVAGAMRGFGVCQVSFAFEGMMDLLAARIGMDPLELRIANALGAGDRNCVGVTVSSSIALRQCLEAVRSDPLWKERERWKSSAGLFRRRGTGIAAVFNAMGYGRGLPDAAIAKIELTPRGTIRVYNGISDMGQGNSSTFVQIAGAILNQDAPRMELEQPDTDRALPSGSSSASRTTYTYANALIPTCEDMKKRLFHWAAMVMLVDDTGTLDLEPGCVVHRPTRKRTPLEFLAGIMPEAERLCTNRFIMPVVQNVPRTGTSFRLGFPHEIFSYAAHVARIEIDELTGAVTVSDYAAVTDAGKLINPASFNQQVQGAVAQGIGYALGEEVLLDRGRILNPRFSDYAVPTALDVPDIVSRSVDSEEPSGPCGMKGVGEVGVNGPLPAIAGAVGDALGFRPARSPLKPERIMGRHDDHGGGGKD